jgi:hypothetical protein
MQLLPGVFSLLPSPFSLLLSPLLSSPLLSSSSLSVVELRIYPPCSEEVQTTWKSLWREIKAQLSDL